MKQNQPYILQEGDILELIHSKYRFLVQRHYSERSTESKENINFSRIPKKKRTSSELLDVGEILPNHFHVKRKKDGSHSKYESSISDSCSPPSTSSSSSSSLELLPSISELKLYYPSSNILRPVLLNGEKQGNEMQISSILSNNDGSRRGSEMELHFLSHPNSNPTIIKNIDLTQELNKTTLPTINELIHHSPTSHSEEPSKDLDFSFPTPWVLSRNNSLSSILSSSSSSSSSLPSTPLYSTTKIFSPSISPMLPSFQEVSAHSLLEKGKESFISSSDEKFETNNEKIKNNKTSKNNAFLEDPELTTNLSKLWEGMEFQWYEEMEKPPFLDVQMYPYQKQALHWMLKVENDPELRGGILAVNNFF